jgi:RNA polymerase sigma factor (TIGR02999 family)
MPAGMKLLRTTPLEFRSGAQPGQLLVIVPMNEVTRILCAVEHGDAQAAEQLLPLIYDELRNLAARRLAQENPGQTLQATELVHEAYLRLVESDFAPSWNGRGHFFAAAAEAMRRILIERARRKRAVVHGGERSRIDLDAVPDLAAAPAGDLLDLDEAVDHLGRKDPLCGQLVKLRCYAGLSVEEAGASLGLSRAEAYRQWTFARAWLRSRLDAGQRA